MEDVIFDLYHKNELLSHVEVKNNKLNVTNYTQSKFFTPFLAPNVNIGTVADLFESRCLERCRPDLQDWLHANNVEEYDPLKIVRNTHGVMMHDYVWIKFDGEDITYEELFNR